MPLAPEQILRFLKTVHPYDGLAESEQATLVSRCDVREVAAGTPIYALKVAWNDPLGGTEGWGPFFYLNNRWVDVPDPGDIFEVAMLKIPDSEIKEHERQLQRFLEVARNNSKQ